MERQVVDLGVILRQFPQFEFSMMTFHDRLHLQKFVYLMQVFGIYLGYDFSWYIRGPYCTHLAACGFALQDKYGEFPDKIDARFINDKIQKKFKDFVDFISAHENDWEFLDMAASLHYLKNTCTLDKGKIIERVVAKQNRFTIDQCEKVWDEMEKWNLL